MDSFLSSCEVNIVDNIKSEKIDAICIIDGNSAPSVFTSDFNDYRKYDQAFDSEVSCLKVLSLEKIVIYSPVGELNDYCDVRRYKKAATKAISRAIKAGAQNVLLILPEDNLFRNGQLCTVLAALQELYVPIQLREDLPEKARRLVSLNIFDDKSKNLQSIVRDAICFEAGRYIARDIGGGDPERMTPIKIEEYIKTIFKDLTINICDEVDILKREYPLFEAVDRAARSVPRHRGRIIFIEYKPPNPAKKTLMLVGKGVTYDTGGADVKANGIMAGMSRDKCGAATVIGFMKVVQQMKPIDIHIVAAVCLVRNSIGEECYVSDEIITSRAGVRVRIGNTDAEGRLCMADALCKFREMAENLPNPHLFTIATLTGHAVIAAGFGYSIAMDNSVARKEKHAQRLSEVGEEYGEPFEVSIIREEDFEFNQGQAIGEDIVQANNLPSSRTPRGHQVPAAFLIKVTGLDKNGLNSKKPIKYTHLDIAGSAGDIPEMPTGAPILALAKTHLISA